MSKTFQIITKVIMLICFISFNCYAEKLNVLQSFAKDNPLSFQDIPTIAQDKYGFMWFGSHAGLHRFDGHNMVNYHHSEDKPDSISPGGVNRIFIDHSDQMWIASTGAGLSLFNPDQQNFTSINTTTTPLTLSSDLVYAIIEDSEKKLWVATADGINVFNKQRDSIRVIIPPLATQGVDGKMIRDIIEVSDGTIWAATQLGISVFDLDGNFIRNILPDQLNNSAAVRLMQHSDGQIWAGSTGGGVFRIDPLTQAIKIYTKDDNSTESVISNVIHKLYEDSEGQVWIGTDKGLSIYDRVSDSFSSYSHVINDANSLTHNLVRDIFEDAQGMVWIGTFSGVNIWNPNLTTFEPYTPLNYPILTDRHISGFSQFNKQHVYFATYSGGIYVLNVNTNQVEKLKLDSYFDELGITTIHIEQNNLWVGTRASGLYQVSLTTNDITAYKHDENNPQSISSNVITNIIRDNRGYLWISTFGGGINRMDEVNKFTRFTQDSTNEKRSLSSNKVLQIVPDNNGYLWLSTYGGGVNRLDLATETVIHLMNDKKDNRSLSSNVVWAIHKDHKNNLWIGTREKGLNFLSFSNQQKGKWEFDHIDLVDGMVSSTVYGVTEDSNGDIWIITSNGISQYSPYTLKFNHFNQSHGLVDMEFNQGAVFRDRNKVLYFGSPKGFNTINPEKIELNYPTPPTHLTGILRLNEPMHFDVELSKIKDLTFEYSDRLISFEYVGLNFADPKATRYRYRLREFDNEWIDAGKLKRATYTNLPSGEYQFEVIAASTDDNWAQQGRTLNITIKPAPWQTWWAYMLYATSIALALLLYSKYVNRKLQSEQQQKVYLKQQVEEQTKEFQLKNKELQHANKQLENAATTDKLTGVRSRRYLDIYIEQATQLMSQIHLNLLPVHRNILPRLYFLMVRIGDVNKITASQLVNLTDLLLYTRNDDDLVIRWSEDTFAVIGYEKDDNARELATRLTERFDKIFNETVNIDMAFSFFPFNFEQPMALSWDQVSVLTEFGLNHVKQEPMMHWLGLYAPKEQPFDYLQALKMNRTEDIAQIIKIRHNTP